MGGSSEMILEKGLSNTWVVVKAKGLSPDKPNVIEWVWDGGLHIGSSQVSCFLNR